MCAKGSLKPGQMCTPIILGQPWQHQYNKVPNWKQEGINFETEEAKFFTPFFDDASSNSDQMSETKSRQEAAINSSNKQVVEWRKKQTIQTKATKHQPKYQKEVAVGEKTA